MRGLPHHSPRPGNLNAKGNPLCPIMLVPDGSECVLALPSLLTSAPAPGVAAFESRIVDKRGRSLVSVSIDCGAQSGRRLSSPGAHSVIERLTLAAWSDGSGLGSCELQAPQRGCRPQCEIFRPDGAPYAKLREEPPPAGQPTGQLGGLQDGARTFSITSAADTPSRLLFSGKVASRSLTVHSSGSQLVAAAEPGHGFHFQAYGVDYYRLRIAPNADAGLIAMAMLAIDRLVAVACT